MSSLDFYDRLPVFTEAGGITDIANYRPVPDDWSVISTDIVKSTQAVADGRYKVVNTAGASVISAVSRTRSRKARNWCHSIRPMRNFRLPGARFR